MAGRVLRRALIVLGGLLALVVPDPAATAQPAPEAAAEAVEAAPDSRVLVQYGFDGEVATGPDTLRVFQNASGRVALSRAFPWSGFSSVELRDLPGDRDFPELQGFFPEVREGSLFLQFALLVPVPDQELNVALAGPRGFRLRRDGIAIWLSTREGWLFHTSDSIPKRLFEVEPFSWYVITIEYRIEAGLYDLWVTRQGETEPFLVRRDQPNAASQPGSSVHLFSFIGDNGDDLSSVVYYVDDVLVARDRPVARQPLVAPGRRRFFADRSAESPEAFLRRCPAVHDLNEIGVEPAATEELSDRDWQLLETLLAGGVPPEPGHRALAPAGLWRQGCAELAAGRTAAAERFFAKGLELAPEALALALGRGLALLGEGRWEALSQLLAELASEAEDPRYARLAALALARTNEVEEALRWLEGPAREAREAGRATAEADAWFVVLRTAGRLQEALDYALSLARSQPAGSPEASRWFLRAGRAAFTLRELTTARMAFEAAKGGAGTSPDPWLSLADVAWLEGDLEAERRLRESVYGRLTWAD